MRVPMAIFAVLLVGCGDSPGTGSVPAPTVDLLADAEITVTGDPDSDLCFSASVPSLDATFEPRCFSPPYSLVIDVVSGQLVDSDDPRVNSLTLLVSPYPLVVTDVQQDGESVRWRQSGGGLLVLGRSLLAAATTVEFELAGEQGVCEFRPDGENCRVR